MIKLRNNFMIILLLSFFSAKTEAAFLMNFFKTVKKEVSNNIKSNKVDEIVSDFEEIKITNNKPEINSRFNSFNINRFYLLEKDLVHEMSKEDIDTNFGNYSATKNLQNCGVRTCHEYIPSGYNLTKKPVVIFVIHGTFASEAEDYYSMNKDFYKNAIEFAKKIADKDKVPVEVVSFKWSGKNSAVDRQNGSVFLAGIINDFYSNRDVYTIAHSHGCNVVNSASKFLDKDVCIEHAIHLACPVRDLSEDKFAPKNIKKMTQFYSNSDMVAAVGSLTQWNLFGPGNCRKFYEGNSITEIKNVRVLLKGSEVGHSNAKEEIVFHLDKILKELGSYNLNKDLTLNIDKDATNPVLLAIRNPVKLEKSVNSEISLNDLLLCKEQAKSEKSKKAFKDIYNKDINYKYNAILRFLNGAYQEIAG